MSLLNAITTALDLIFNLLIMLLIILFCHLIKLFCLLDLFLKFFVTFNSINYFLRVCLHTSLFSDLVTTITYNLLTKTRFDVKDLKKSFKNK